MAAGRPVISTAVGGVVDLLGRPLEEHDRFTICERGVRVESHSADDFCKGLIYLAKNERLREETAARGQRYVESHHGKQRLVSDIKQLYRSLK